MDDLPPPSLPLGGTLGPYRILELINIGGMAEIYLSEVLDVQGRRRQLALKVIHAELADDPRFVQMLKDEATLAVGLDHPHIVQTFDLGCVDNVFFLPMEYIDGFDLFKLLKRVTKGGGQLPVSVALFITHKMLSGLQYAHEKHDAQGQPLTIIHRDISPQNILLSRQGAVKLVDFGIAKAANLSSRTRAGMIKGKLVYMSPEQSFGEKLDQRSDLYSAGVVLYEALTGRSLYTENNPVQLIQMVRRAEIPPPSTLRPELGDVDGLVMRALQRSPDDRYQSAREFHAVLAEELQRQAPNYDAQALGGFMRSVLDEQEDAPRRVTMRRDHFPVPRHSVIPSQQEMNDQVPQEMSDQVPAGDLTLTPGPRDPSAPVGRVLLFEEGRETTSYDIDGQFVLGRGGDLRLTDGRVSRQHARIVFHESAYLLEDLHSSNGTFLNEQKINEIRELKHGDRIRIGPFQLQFALEGKPMNALVAPSGEYEPQQPAATASATAPRADIRSTKEEASPAEATTPQTRVACFKTALGDETLRIPITTKLTLGQSLDVSGDRIDGPAATVLRRGDAYWIEPTPLREVVTVNGQQVVRPRQLSSGDRVEMGSLELVFFPPAES
ncbi:MAG: protein kinase [Deltaproteobacteria bacterium]|nr:protein kinase [Deltaproteobacteria bacterium]